MDCEENESTDAQRLGTDEAAPEEPGAESVTLEPSDRQGSDGGSEPADRSKSDERTRAKPTRTRQSFSWRQVSVLEQVFEQDPLPRQVHLRKFHALHLVLHVKRVRACLFDSPAVSSIRAGAPPSPARSPSVACSLSPRAIRSSECNLRSVLVSRPAVCRSGFRTGGKSGRRSSSRWASHPHHSSRHRVA